MNDIISYIPTIKLYWLVPAILGGEWKKITFRNKSFRMMSKSNRYFCSRVDTEIYNCAGTGNSAQLKRGFTVCLEMTKKTFLVLKSAGKVFLNSNTKGSTAKKRPTS